MNRLGNETSPYLLQHKNNPVDWYPWCEEAWEKAKKEKKLVLISIGYSACHWCHVMEHEVFEDEETAAYMNANFVNIKVDREERPDIDQVYMQAVQLMTQRGGWPLNCFVLPDGKPIYGGTYFPKDQWLQILNRLVELQTDQLPKLEEYAERLTEGVRNFEVIELEDESSFDSDHLVQSIEKWSGNFDWNEGGMKQAPKFPMPNNYLFVQQYGELFQDKNVLEFVDLTLTKMARGGIYDQLGGGFYRYSVDAIWKVPHFEKMLYDNGQLLSLFAKAYIRTKNEEYQKVISQTVSFLQEELLSEDGGFYSALDADSEGVEGKYYVWTKEELKEVLDSDYDTAVAYYSVNEKGYWENDNYILCRSSLDSGTKTETIRTKLLEARSRRIKPELDDKILTSWNAMTISGLTDSFVATGDQNYLDLAVQCAGYLESNLLETRGKLYHSCQKGIVKVDGFLEDYAFTASAFLQLFEVTSNEDYLLKTKELIDFAIEQFYDANNGLFNFTANNSEVLIARKQEITDNVIPASNSEMAHVLLTYGRYVGNNDLISMSKQMLSNMWQYIPNYASGYSNWGLLGLRFIHGYKEVVVSGPNATNICATIRSEGGPSIAVLHCVKESELSIFSGRYSESETRIFVCEEGVCKAPVSSVDEALKLI